MKDLETKVEDIPKQKKLKAYWDDGSIYTCAFIGVKKTFDYKVCILNSISAKFFLLIVISYFQIP